MTVNTTFNPLQGHVFSSENYQTSLPTAPLNQWVQSFWQLSVPAGDFSYHSIPDNSVDWIINTHCFEDNFVVAPFFSPAVFDLVGPVSYFGIRFRILGHHGLVSHPLGDWCSEGVVSAQDLIPNEMLHTVFASIEENFSFNDRCRSVSASLLQRIENRLLDSRVTQFINNCFDDMGLHKNVDSNQPVGCGVSSRHLRRLTQLYLGCSPKDFTRVLRFQKTLESLKTGINSNSWADYYYDQPHFIREFKRLTGHTPVNFLNWSVLSNKNLTNR